MVSFEDTKVAFAGKSDADLRQARLLFQLLARPELVSVGGKLSSWALQAGLPVKGLIKKTIFRQFVGGETIEACEPVIRALGGHQTGTILDYSVEGQNNEVSFDKSTDEIVRTVVRAAGEERIPFAVFKTTGIAPKDVLEKVSLGQDLNAADAAAWERVQNRVERIFLAAQDHSVPVLIDAEESWLQGAIDFLAEQMMRRFNTQIPLAVTTIQLYRHDRLEYLKNLHQKAECEGFFIGAKLVRGAYMEKERERAAAKGYPDPIQPNREATDRDFDTACTFCLQHHHRIHSVLGTHNEASCLKAVAQMAALGLPSNAPAVWFAQLLGMSDHISFNLANEGYNVAKYVPYGPVKELLPYMERRARENTSVRGQTGRELALIHKELERRHRDVPAGPRLRHA